MAEEKKRLTEKEARRIRHVYAATDVDLERYREEDWFQELVAFKK